MAARTATAPGAPTHPAGQGRATSSTTGCIVAGPAAPDAEQGLPRPLVVPAGRDRALLVHHPAADRHVPDVLLRRRRCARSSTTAATRRCAASRCRAAYDSTLNISFDVRGGLFMRQMHHWAALLFVAAIVVHMLRVFFTGAFRKPREINWIIGVGLLVLGLARGLRRLLAARRPALRHRPADRQRDHAVDPGHRHLGALRGLRRRVPRRADHRPVLHRPRAADPGDPAGADRACTWPDPGQAEAHPVPRPGPHRAQRGRQPALPDLRRQGRRASSSSSSACAPRSAAWCRSTRSGCSGPYNPAQVSAGSQPDWYIGVPRRLDPSVPAVGDQTCPATTRSRRCSGRRSCCRASCSRCSRSTRSSRRKLTKDTAVAPPAAASARRPGAHRARRHGARVLRGAADLRRQRRHRRQVRHQPQRDDLGRPDRRCSSCRRSPTASPTGSASACSSTTARCSSTASRPASSGGCRTASSSRSTSRSARSTSTATASWPTAARRCRRR